MSIDVCRAPGEQFDSGWRGIKNRFFSQRDEDRASRRSAPDEPEGAAQPYFGATSSRSSSWRCSSSEIHSTRRYSLRKSSETPSDRASWMTNR